MRPDRRLRVLWLLLAAMLGAGLLLALVALAPFVRAFLALMLVFLPSYLILWPVLQPRLGSVGAFTIAGGMSIAIVVLAGLGLNLLPWGIQAATWLGFVAFLFVVALAFGLRPTSWRLRRGFASHELVLGGIGALMLMAALIFARLFAAYPSEAFTQLWISPSVETTTSGVQVNIRSEEEATTGYRLVVLRNGAQVESWDDITLTTGQSWSTSVSVGSGRIEARLFDLSNPGTVYRYVKLRLDTSEQAALRDGA